MFSLSQNTLTLLHMEGVVKFHSSRFVVTCECNVRGIDTKDAMINAIGSMIRATARVICVWFRRTMHLERKVDKHHEI